MAEYNEDKNLKSLDDRIKEDKNYFSSERENHKKSQVFLLSLIGSAFLLSLLLWFINYKSFKGFHEYSIVTKAKVINAEDVYFRVNDMDGTSVYYYYYYVTYQYLVKEDSTSSYFKI